MLVEGAVKEMIFGIYVCLEGVSEARLVWSCLFPFTSGNGKMCGKKKKKKEKRKWGNRREFQWDIDMAGLAACLLSRLVMRVSDVLPFLLLCLLFISTFFFKL